MAAQLGVTFTGLRFENPFLLASAPPTESDSNIMRAFDAGWGGVVTKTIGLHPVVNVAGPKTKFLRATPDSPHLSMQKRAGHGAPLVVELGAHLRQAARLVGAAHRAHQAGPSVAHPRGLDHGRLRQRRGARPLADAGAGVPGRRRRRARAEPVVPAHGPQGHGLEHRQGRGAHLDRRRRSSRKSRACRSGPSSRRPPPTSSSKRAGRSSAAPTPIVVVEHVPVAAAHRSRDARVRDERGRPRVERRPGRPGDPAAVDGQDGAADAGVSRQGVLRHRRHRRVRARAQLLPARLRHGAGVHGGDARPCDRAERDQERCSPA